MKLRVIKYLAAMVWLCTSKIFKMVSDIQELMPLGCLHLKELVPNLIRNSLIFMKLTEYEVGVMYMNFH